MIFCRQGPYECLPATVAMLSGRSLDEVRAFGETNGIPWEETVRTDAFWEAAKAILARFINEPTAAAFDKFYDARRYNFGLTAALPWHTLIGKSGFAGIIINDWNRHAIAVYHGTIYDPGEDGPLLFEKWEHRAKKLELFLAVGELE